MQKKKKKLERPMRSPPSILIAFLMEKENSARSVGLCLPCIVVAQMWWHIFYVLCRLVAGYIHKSQKDKWLSGIQQTVITNLLVKTSWGSMLKMQIPWIHPEDTKGGILKCAFLRNFLFIALTPFCQSIAENISLL